MAFPVGWDFKQKLTIQNGKIPGTLTDFPVLITRDHLHNDIVDPSGSDNSQADGGDVRFSSDSAGVTQLACEVVEWEHDTSTGAGDAAIQVHVKVPSISASVDTDIYIWYKTSGSDSQPAVTATYGRNNVWSGYEAVYHLEEDPSGTAPQIIDSTGNGHDGTSEGFMTSGDSVAGQIGNALDFDNVDDDINCGIGAGLEVQGCTITAFINPTAILYDPKTGIIWAKSDDISADGIEIGLRQDTGELGFAYNDGAIRGWFNSTFVFTTGSWQRAAVVWRKSAGEVDLYKNKIKNTVATTTGTITYANDTARIAFQSSSNAFFDGLIDELRITHSERNSDWLDAEYDNQSAPATFIIEGTPEATGGDLAITIGLHTNTSVIPTFTIVAQATQIITAGLLTNANVIPTHTVVAQAEQAITIGLLTNTNVIRTLSIGFGVAQEITVGLITNVNVIQLATVVTQATQVITVGLYTNPNIIHILGITGPVTLEIGVPHTRSLNRIHLTKLSGVALSVGLEVIPYAPTVPESVRQLNEPLFGFLEDQTRTLRDQHVKMTHGQTTMNFDALFQLYDAPQFDPGVFGRFNHPLYGLIIARFVCFTRMDESQPGGPVGFNPGTDHLDWVVTNDLTQSDPFHAVGLIATGESIVDGQYGWVIVQGANIQPVMLKAGETATQGKEIAWSGTNEISVTEDGVTLGFYVAFVDVDSVTGFKAGDLIVQMGSNTNRAVVNAQGLRIDGVDARIDGVDALVSTLTSVVADGDAAIAIQITTIEADVAGNTAVLLSERLARVEGDSILATSVDNLAAQLGTEVIALNSTIKTVEAGINAARAVELQQLRVELQNGIDENQLIAASVETQVTALVTQQNIQASSFTEIRVDAEIAASVVVALDARVVVNEDDIVTAFARWAVTINVDGHVSGLELVSTLDSKSTFTVNVDKFLIANPSTSETVFEIDGGVVKLKELVVSQLIRSDNWNSGGNSEGFSLDRTTGVFKGQGIEIRNSSGSVIFGVGGAIMATITDAGLFATAPQLTSGNISTYIANAAIGTLQVGTLNASVITAGTITASRFLTDEGVDLAAIVPGVLNVFRNETDVQTFSIGPGAEEKFFDWVTSFENDNHRITILLAELDARRIGGTSNPAGVKKLYRRIDGGTPTEIASGGYFVSISSFVTLEVAADLADNPTAGTIEYRIGITHNGSSDATVEVTLGHVDLEGVFRK